MWENKTSAASQSLGVSQRGNLWRGQVVTGVIEGGSSQKWEGSNASGDRPHVSVWLHRSVELMLCSSRPRDGLHRAATAALGPQQISRLRQDGRPGGTLLALTLTSHSDNRAHIYAGRLLNGCQSCTRLHDTPSMHDTAEPQPESPVSTGNGQI